MKRKSLHPIVLLTLLVSLSLFIPSYISALSISVRSFDHNAFTRVVFEGDRSFEFNVDYSKKALNLKLKEQAQVLNEKAGSRHSSLIEKVEHHVKNGKSVFDLQLASDYQVKRNFVLERPYRVVFDLVKTTSPAPDSETRTNSNKTSPDTPPEPTELTEKPKPDDSSIPQDAGERDPEEDQTETSSEDNQEPSALPLLQEAGKKRGAIEVICIDPGHGGNDIGAIGNQKTEEKDITLKIAQKLKRLIVSRLGLRVVMTREKDTEVSLNSRVSIANNEKAQLFVSIHVNASFRKAARGPETFFVSLKATDQDALKLSQKENESFKVIDKYTEDDDLKLILWDMAQNEYIKESSKLAEYIQNELNVLMHTRNRGVKQAPFRVLMRAAMPAVLVEVAFVSNPFEEKKLLDDAFLSDISNAIYTGILKFIYYHNRVYR